MRMLNWFRDKIVSAFGGRRRYRVTFDRGRRERGGFRYRKEAISWALDNCRPGDWVVDEPEAIDLRIVRSEESERSRWVG